MDDEERGALDDKQMLFTLLTALVKRSESGEIRISETEMDSVNRKDMMMMYYDQDNKEIILSTHFLGGAGGGLGGTGDN